MTVTVYSAPGTLTDDEVARWRAIPVAVAVDLDPLAQIDPAIRPLCPPGRQTRLFGRAVTALVGPPDFGAVVHALDVIRPGEVLVIAAAGHRETAMIGEVLGGHLRGIGVAGIVCDGAVRDVGTLAGWDDFPVFSRWITPRGPTSADRGAVNRAVVVGGRLVSAGDLVIGDDDGLVCLSPASVRGLIDAAEAKLSREAEWTASLARGVSAAATFGLKDPARG
jgi:4-hydroxy-4-methyl-2-oxoglutarate aldolase